MPIKLPTEITYFYEITGITDRLYYCIPINELQSMVTNGLVSKSIIEDYPDGVDIKVSPLQFKEFQDLYEMTLDIEPQLIWKAFQLIKSKIRKKHLGTGFIKRVFLENTVKEIQADFKEIMLPRPKVDKRPAAIKSQKRVQHRMRISERRLNRKLKQLSIEDIDPKKTIVEQSFAEIKMTKGDEPFEFFSRYYLKSKKKK